MNDGNIYEEIDYVVAVWRADHSGQLPERLQVSKDHKNVLGSSASYSIGNRSIP